jgi:putative phosphoesterase
LSSAEHQEIIRIGVVADTHVPDRARSLHPELIPGLADRGVSQIWHAGDVCVPTVVEELQQIAPVTAVGGNRDYWFGHRLPAVRFMDIGSISIALVHGHGGLLPYFWDKWYYLLEGYRQERYLNRLKKAAPFAKVVVFGHTHQRANLWLEGQLFFNPGSASIEPLRNGKPSYGILHFCKDGSVRGEVIELNGARLENRRWLQAV